MRTAFLAASLLLLLLPGSFAYPSGDNSTAFNSERAEYDIFANHAGESTDKDKAAAVAGYSIPELHWQYTPPATERVFSTLDFLSGNLARAPPLP